MVDSKTENILLLLRSDDRSNRNLGLQLLLGFPLPGEAISDLAAIFLWGAELREPASQILKLANQTPLLEKLQALLPPPAARKESISEIVEKVLQFPEIDPESFCWQSWYCMKHSSHERSFFNRVLPYSSKETFERNGLVKEGSVNLEGRSLNQFPKALFHFHGVQEINLSSNKLSRLPLNFSRFSRLWDINLAWNQFKEFPVPLSGCSLLTHIDLDHNQIITISPHIGKLKALRHLNLHHNNISQLPENIRNLSQLSFLNLDDNFLNELPQGLSSLQSLRTLSLRDNRLTTFPSVIFQLTDLMDLELGKNPIKILPPEIGRMEGLRQLGLENTELYELPEELYGLGLVFLNLEKNHFERLSNRICGWRSLKWLILNDNPLQELPETLGQMPKLSRISLSKMDELDWEQAIRIMKTMRNLVTLDLEKNWLNEAVLARIKEELPMIEVREEWEGTTPF